MNPICATASLVFSHYSLSSRFPLLSGESFYYTIKTEIHDMPRNRRIAGGSDQTVISRERGLPGVGLGVTRTVRRDS